MNRTAIYARVSTTDQDYAMQVEELRRIASQSKWEVVGEYTEKVSGAKSRGKRPELDRLLKDIHKRKIDNVMVWKLDRLGRSLVDLIHIIEEINKSGANLYSREDGIDTNTKYGKLLFTFIGSFAEFQRDLINENVIAGQARAKERGVKFGRPAMRDSKRKRIEDTLASGLSSRKTAEKLNVPYGTVSKIRREMSEADPTLRRERLANIDLGTFRVKRTKDSTTVKKIAEGVDPKALKEALDVQVTELNYIPVNKPKQSDVA